MEALSSLTRSKTVGWKWDVSVSYLRDYCVLLLENEILLWILESHFILSFSTFSVAREKISQTFRDAMGDTYSSSNPYKRKRRSFEKKHNAIVDIIKRRRGSSPTSVMPLGAFSPTSPPSPDPGMGMSGDLQQLAPHPAALAAVPTTSTPQQNKTAMDDAINRPGQIGFARRLSLQMGMAAGAPQHYHHRPHPITPSPHHHAVVRMRAPLPAAGGMFPVDLHHHHLPPHFMAAGSPHHPVAAHAMPPLVPPHRRSSMPAGYHPAIMSDMMHRQRMARNAAMMGRTSN